MPNPIRRLLRLFRTRGAPPPAALAAAVAPDAPVAPEGPMAPNGPATPVDDTPSAAHVPEPDQAEPASGSETAETERIVTALEALINAPSWEAKREIIERDQEALLTERADEALAALIAQYRASADDEERTEADYLNLHRTLLRRCREIGIAEAWAELDAARQAAQQAAQQAAATSEIAAPASEPSDQPPPLDDADAEAVARALGDFVNAKSWEETRAVLEREQALLLTLTANRLLKAAIERASAGGAEEGETMARELERNRGLLRRARSIGIAAAWADFEAMRQAAAAEAERGERPVVQTLLTWLNTRDFRDERRVLEAHLEILSAESDEMLHGLIWGYYGRSGEDGLRDALRLLDDIRARGGTTQAIREGYVNAYGGFALDLPPWLDEVVSRFDNLRGAGHPYQTAAARTALLRDALERAAGASDVAPEAAAELYNALSTALEEDPLTPRAHALEDAIAARVAARSIYTFDRYPRQYAMTQNNLGATYRERLAGNRRENLEESIRCYQEALRVRTLADFPQDYAMTQNNLGATYRNRLAGNRRENLEESIRCYREALRVYTLADFPADFRNTHLNLAWLALDSLARDAEKTGDQGARHAALEMAHSAYAEARRAQAELGWLASDAQSRASLQGESHPLREMYVRDAWCLWQLGRPSEAVTALEAARAQALAEIQAIVGVALEGLCGQHRQEFIAAREQLDGARALGERGQVRAARDHFLAVREAIRGHCQRDFLPSEPEYGDIAGAAPDQALVYLAATDETGFACIVPPAAPATDQTTGRASVGKRDPIITPLPRLTWRAVDDWLLRPDEERNVVGGLRLALSHQAEDLLVWWLERLDDETEQGRLLALPLREVAAAIPAEYATLKESLKRTTAAWREEADILSGGSLAEQAKARALRQRLALPLGEALKQRALAGDLDWFFLEAELEALLPHFSDAAMRPLREALDQLGLRSPDQRIALIPCGRLGALPLHAADVPDPLNGELVPFAETCELALQPSARALATARTTADALPREGPVIAVGNPRPTREHDLPWAGKEAEAVALLGRRAGRGASRSLLREEATLRSFGDALEGVRKGRLGALVEVASHGHSDPADPRRCFMVLAYDELLTLADLQRGQLLEGVRCFAAAGCVTGLGDLETAPDELGSFAAGVLQAGSPAALATLWPVDDRATFLLMLRFHETMLAHPGVTPAQALREASRWLRGASADEVKRAAKAGLKGTRGARESADAEEAEGAEGAEGADDDTLATEDVDMVAVRGVTDLDASNETVEGDVTRMTSAEALQHLSRLRSTSGQRPPYAHPIYWACAIVYGA